MELFDDCQILEAYITKSGWEFLIKFYGYEKLYEIDRKSGWHEGQEDPYNLDEYVKWVEYEMEISIKE